MAHGDLDGVTRQKAELVGRTSDTARAVGGQAQQLVRSAQHFVLADGAAAAPGFAAGGALKAPSGVR